MKITLIAALGVPVLVSSCIHTTETRQSSDTVCTAEYRPHLCVATAGKRTFAAHGSNQCEARNKLNRLLKQASVGAADIECGKVHR